MPYRRPNEAARPCTCPDDSRPRPCQQRYALSECIEAQKSLRPLPYERPYEPYVSDEQRADDAAQHNFHVVRFLQLQYESDRRIYRIANPHRERADIEPKD